MSQNKRRAKRKLNLLRLLILFIALIVVTGGVVSIGLFFTSVRDMPALTPGTL